jgi:galactoside O-acetyltransferase
MAALSQHELEAIGFKSIGENVRLSDKASVYRPEKISIADHVRIDDFCILSAGSGGIRIGRYVHVACYASLIGAGEIVLEDFAGVSGRVSIYSSNDDSSGAYMVSPTIPMKYRNVTDGRVLIQKHALVLTGAVILPGVTVGTGAVVGALALVKDDCEEFGVYVGCPAKRVGRRRRDLLRHEAQLRQVEGQ